MSLKKIVFFIIAAVLSIGLMVGCKSSENKTEEGTSITDVSSEGISSETKLDTETGSTESMDGETEAASEDEDVEGLSIEDEFDIDLEEGEVGGGL